MKTIFTLRTGLLLAFILTLTAQSYSQQLGDYRTNGSGQNFNTATVFDRWNGSGWVTSTYAPGAGGNPPFKQTVDLTSGSTTATITGTDTNYGLIRANQFAVSGTALQAGTTISSVSGSTINLSKTALTTGTAAQLNFQEQIAMTGTAAMGSNTYTITAVGSGSDILPGMAFTSGTNIPAGTVVSSVAGDVVTLSNNTTAAITTGTFFTKETTAATTAGSTTITLAAPNSLLSVGMNVYNSSSIPYGTKIISVSGTTVVLSMPATATYVGVGVVFAYNIIPNLYINHTVLGNGNSLSSTVKNAWVNNQNGSTTAGIYNISDGTTSTITPFGPYTYALNPIFTVGNNANIANLVFQTLSIAAGAKAQTNQTASVYTHNLILNGGEGGNAINNNGIIDFVTSNGHKTNISFAHIGNTTVTGTPPFTTTFNLFSILVPNSTVTIAANASCTGGTLAQGSSILTTNGAVLTGSELITLKTNTFDKLGSEIKMWPNPTHDLFNIMNTQNEMDGASTIEISNLNGQVVHSHKSNPGTTSTIQTNSWAKGVYMVKTSNNGSQTTKKLIIQ